MHRIVDCCSARDVHAPHGPLTPNDWPQMHASLMNNTKWEEVRLAMVGLGAERPEWRNKTLGAGYVSEWDGEWFYHFSIGGYKDIEWVEVRTRNIAQKEKILSALRLIHVPGHETENGFKIHGYADSNCAIEYI